MSSTIGGESILLVEDDDSLRNSLTTVLEHHGFRVHACAHAEQAYLLLSDTYFDCILTDLRLPGDDGIALLREVRNLSISTPLIIMTAYGSIDMAVRAIKGGANDFITKPFLPDELCAQIRQVIAHRRIVDRDPAARSRRERVLLTRDTQLQKVLDQAERCARVDSSVLLLGESGTGKELTARFIHDRSPRRGEQFVAVNCGAIPPDLLESEFFGHEQGAFTGATQTRTGILEFATAGTVFLDEVGDLPAAMQVKLLRALQEHEIRRVGGNKTVKVNPRIIAATNRDIAELIASGAMREDFYYRIAVITLTLPSLRSRPADLELLVTTFLERFAQQAGRETPQIAPVTWEYLRAYNWPGNARELENTIERAVILAREVILPEHLGISLPIDFASLAETAQTLPEIAARAARRAEVETIARVLRQTSGNKSRAAQLLGVSYKTLLNKIKEYGLEAARDTGARPNP